MRYAVIAHLGDLTDHQKQALHDLLTPHDTVLSPDAGQGDCDVCWTVVGAGALLELWPDQNDQWRNHFEKHSHILNNKSVTVTTTYGLDGRLLPPGPRTARLTGSADHLVLVCPPLDKLEYWMNHSENVHAAVAQMRTLSLPVTFLFAAPLPEPAAVPIPK